MVILILSWIVLFLVILAFGNIFILVWNKLTGKNEKHTVVDRFWIGISAIGMLTIVLSVFIPINIYVLSLVLFLSFIYWASHLYQLRVLFDNIIRGFRQMHWSVKILVCLAFILILIQGLLSPMVLGDHELYHYQTMKWTERYSVVPGLGNLHGRLAFNSSFFLITTLFSFHPDHFPLFYPLNGLCFLVFSVWLFSNIKKDSPLFYVIGILGIYISFMYVFRIVLSSSSNDVLSNILVAYILISAAFKRDQQSLMARVLPLVLISTFCITLKLSSILIILIPLYVVFLLIRNKEYRFVACLIALMSIIIFPWIVRFVVLSGYLIYPFPSIDIFSFDWKMSIGSVQLEKNWVTSWARIPGMDQKIVLAMPFMEWFPEWVREQDLAMLLLQVLAIISPLYFLFLNKKNNLIFIFIWLTSFVGFIYCFTLAPALRFYVGFTATTAFLPLLICQRFQIRLLNVGILLLVGLYIIKSGYTEFARMKLFSSENPFIYPTFYNTQKCEDLNRETYIFEDTQKVIYIYRDGEEQGQNSCFPSVLSRHLNLEMRGDDFQDGFRLSKKNSK